MCLQLLRQVFLLLLCYTIRTPFIFSVHCVILLLPVLLTVYTRHPSTLCVSTNVVLSLSPSLSLKSLAKEKESQDLFVSVTEFDKQQPNKMDPFASYKIKTEVYRSTNFMYVLMCNTNHVCLFVCLSVCLLCVRTLPCTIGVKLIVVAGGTGGQVLAGLTLPVLWFVAGYPSISAFSFVDDRHFLIIVPIDFRFYQT